MKIIEQRGGAEVTTESRDMREVERQLIGKVLDHAVDMRPEGTTVNGMALVLYFESESGGAYSCVTAMEHMNEVFADGGIKSLANHCKKIFRNRDDKDRTN